VCFEIFPGCFTEADRLDRLSSLLSALLTALGEGVDLSASIFVSSWFRFLASARVNVLAEPRPMSMFGGFFFPGRGAAPGT
jgi:hypothetical protein